jgi:hypothetical protein
MTNNGWLLVLLYPRSINWHGPDCNIRPHLVYIIIILREILREILMDVA